MLTLFYSNRYEVLTEALLAGLADSRGPWTRETVIVPSAAIRRRLELDIAQRQGICANLEFTYLAQWIWARIGAVLPVPEQSPFAADRLAWRCYRLLEAASGAQPSASSVSSASQSPAPPSHQSHRLAAYLAQADETMRYELAQRVATVFDHYLTYRPEWLNAWQQGLSIFEPTGEPVRLNANLAQADAAAREDEQWQAPLWRALLEEIVTDLASDTGAAAERTPPAYRFLRLAPALDQAAVTRACWPERVAVFALPTMPPLQIALLRELARWIDVRMYVMNPCREYWTDILPQAQVDNLALREVADYHEVGNPLLAEWGRQTQAQLHMLQELTEGAAGREAAHYEDNPASTLLAACQNAILELAPLPRWSAGGVPARGLEDGEAEENEAQAGVEVHVCHSLARQLEALHDRLLALFDAEPALQPGDVMVALPDLAGAAPLIEAVFGSAPVSRRIPFRISGLPPSRTNPVARVLLELLAASVEATPVPTLIEWLRVDAIAARYAIAAGDLEQIQNWLAAAGARRGLAADDARGNDGNNGGRDVETHGESNEGDAPAPARHTLADALLRLYLGYAMPDAADPVDAYLPVAGAEGAQADLLGRVALFADQIEQLVRTCSAPCPGAAWAARLRGALDTVFAAELPFHDDLAAVREAIDAMARQIDEGAAQVLLPAAVVRLALAGALDDPARGGVPWGAVTFSALTSLRGLPFKVICLLDLNDGALPSITRADEFDLIAAFPKLGDRQRRDDERNLFLDLLLAARERLLIYYTGRSIRDNTVLPPAALVDALLDHLAGAAAGVHASPAQWRTARGRLITEHPLQPFAAAYALGEQGLYTYDTDRARIAALLNDPQPRSAPAFFAEPLPAVDAASEASGISGATANPAIDSLGGTIEFDALERFWRHPVRALLRERLGLALFDAPPTLEDREPYALAWSARAALAARILPVLLDVAPQTGATPIPATAPAAALERVRRIAAASPELPSGAIGEVWRARTQSSLAALAAVVRDALEGRAQRLPFVLQFPACWPDAAAGQDHGEPEDPFARDALAPWLPLFDDRPVVLSGVLGSLSPHGQVLYRFARASARDYLSAWLAHLVLCAQAPPGIAPRTWWFGEGSGFMLEPVAAPLVPLGQLAALYRIGLRSPLPFYPRSAWAQVSKGPLEARNAWLGHQHAQGEAEDEYLRAALRGTVDASDPTQVLGAAFVHLAQTVFAPLRAHLREDVARLAPSVEA